MKFQSALSLFPDFVETIIKLNAVPPGVSDADGGSRPDGGDQAGSCLDEGGQTPPLPPLSRVSASPSICRAGIHLLGSTLSRTNSNGDDEDDDKDGDYVSEEASFTSEDLEGVVFQGEDGDSILAVHAVKGAGECCSQRFYRLRSSSYLPAPQ